MLHRWILFLEVSRFTIKFHHESCVNSLLLLCWLRLAVGRLIISSSMYNSSFRSSHYASLVCVEIVIVLQRVVSPPPTVNKGRDTLKTLRVLFCSQPSGARLFSRLYYLLCFKEYCVSIIISAYRW